MKQILVLALLGLHFHVNAQYTLPQDLPDYTILIEFEDGSSGSGFMFLDSLTNNVFFVTARHVVLTETFDTSGKIIDYRLSSQWGTIKYYSRTPDKTFPNSIKTDFLGLYKSGQVKFKPKDDILVARIGKLSKTGYDHIEYDQFVIKQGKSALLKPLSTNLIGRFDSTNIGDDVFIFGYPKSLGLKEIPQYDFNKPLLRKGSIAGRNSEQKTIIIDCPSFGGNSGGPVYEIKGTPFDAKYQLIGIVVSFIPLVEEWENRQYKIRNITFVNSGYSVVEPIDKIEDLIKEFY